MIIIRDFIIISILLTAVLAFSWVGLGGSWGDDWIYSEAALGWLSDGLFVGDTHWELRYPHVLPIASSYALFGFGEFQLVLPTIIYFALIIFVVYHFLNEFTGRHVALITCLLLVITPLLIVSATTSTVDITEAFFIFLSGYLFWRALQSRVPLRTLFFAGVAAGLGWATRETSVGLIATYGMLFLAGYRYQRWQYFVIAAGGAMVAAIEAAYMTVMTGNPMYRYMIDFFMQKAAIEGRAGEVGVLPGIGEAVSSVAGNIGSNWIVDPFLALLINQEFGLIFWVGIPLGAWLCFSPRVEGNHRDLARFLSLLAVAWFVLIAYGMNLRELPRYFTMPTIAAVMLTGIWLVHYRGEIPRTVWTVLAGLLVSVNFFSIYIENKSIFYAEREALHLVAESPEPVYTDSKTLERFNKLLKFKNLHGTVVAAPPPPGAMYFYSPGNLAEIETRKNSPDVAPFRPKQDWVQIGYFDPGRKYSGIALEKLGLKQFIPESIYAKLNTPNLPLTAYRVPGGGSGENPAQ